MHTEQQATNKNKSTLTEETITQYVSYSFQGGMFLNLCRVATETILVPSLGTFDKSWHYYCMTCYQLFISQPSYWCENPGAWSSLGISKKFFIGKTTKLILKIFTYLTWCTPQCLNIWMWKGQQKDSNQDANTQSSCWLIQLQSANKELPLLGFEVLMAVSINTMPCFRAACCLHIQGRIHI
jgi:hypothetical protein